MSVMTTSEYLIQNAEKYANSIALSSKDKSGEWNNTTWSEFYNDTMALSKALMAPIVAVCLGIVARWTKL